MAVLLVAGLVAVESVVSCSCGWWSSLVGHALKVLPMSSTAGLVAALAVIGVYCVV